MARTNLFAYAGVTVTMLATVLMLAGWRPGAAVRRLRSLRLPRRRSGTKDAPQAITAGPEPGRDLVPYRPAEAPPRPAELVPIPVVRRFLVDRPCNPVEHEPRLPARVVVGCGWHDSFFRGWCSAVRKPRPTVRLTVRGAALRGTTHASAGTEGQDALGVAWDSEREALYVAVADGLGSLSGSGPVAVQAVSAALHLSVNRPPKLDFAESGDRLFESIAAGLRRTFGSVEGACTLVVAEVVPRLDGAAIAVHGVGDSEAWVLFHGDWSPLHHERRARDNGTRDLPTHVVPNTTAYDVPPGSVLVLGSDGFAGALDTSVSPLARGLAEYWQLVPPWLDFVNHVSFVDDYWADDRAAVGVWIGGDPT